MADRTKVASSADRRPTIDLEAIKARAEAATPGPWWHEWVDGDDWWAVYGQPTGDMVCPEVCTMWSSDDAAYIATAREDVPALVAEIERLTGEPTEDEVDRVADVLAAHGYRVTWDWYPFCTCGWRADQPRDVASYDRHVARAALRAARGRS